MTKPKKTKSISLTVNQVGHLISGAVRNLIDLKIHEDREGYKYLLILDCVAPERCIPANQEPESEDESIDIMSAHTVLELSEYFEAVLGVKHEDGKFYRGFSTVGINKKNMVAFIESLTELEQFWIQIEHENEEEEDIKNKAEGKNFVEGNGTVN